MLQFQICKRLRFGATIGITSVLVTSFQTPVFAVDGTFTGATSNTAYGPVQVQIDVQNSKIVAVRATQLPTGTAIDDQIDAQAIPILTSETLAAQSADIQGVSGASYTSQGWYDSLVSALAKAALAPAPTLALAPAPAPTPVLNDSFSSQELTDAANAGVNAANTAADSLDAATQAAQDAGDKADAALAAVTSAQQSGQYGAALNQSQVVLASYQNTLQLTQASLDKFRHQGIFFIGTDTISNSPVTANGSLNASIAIRSKLNSDQLALNTFQSALAADSPGSIQAKIAQVAVSNYTQAISIRDRTLNQISVQDAKLQSMINNDQDAILKWTATVNYLITAMKSASSTTPPKNAPQAIGDSGGQPSTNASSTPDLSPDISNSDSITVTLINSKKSRIDIDSSYPSTKLTVIASKKGMKKKLTYHVTTKNDGTLSFTTPINLKGYTVILLNGTNELDRSIGGQ